METKTYFANNLSAAIEAARQELGPDALLVHSKPAPPGARQFGRVEVAFAWDPAVSRNAGAGEGNTLTISRHKELDEIRLQIAALQASSLQALSLQALSLKAPVLRVKQEKESAERGGAVFDRL